ncbi:hypothetical protein DFH06DRAFT_770387 [Mycena polygramma]|nr:hypothetical protein DFH06DRAFT_770387 [Mycena polygramma]
MMPRRAVSTYLLSQHSSSSPLTTPTTPLFIMACTPKVYVKAYLAGCVIAVFLIVTPVLIETYYPQAAPVAEALVWVTNTISRGFGALCFVMAVGLLGSLGNSARKGLVRLCTRRASPATGPISLEDGTAEAEAPLTPPAAAADATPATAEKSKPTIVSKVLSLLSFTYFFTRQVMLNELVSFDRPALDNVLAVALYVLRGLEVVFAMFLALLFVAWVRYKKPAAPAAVEAPVLPVVAEAPVEVKEKDEKELLIETEA